MRMREAARLRKPVLSQASPELAISILRHGGAPACLQPVSIAMGGEVTSPGPGPSSKNWEDEIGLEGS